MDQLGAPPAARPVPGPAAAAVVDRSNYYGFEHGNFLRTNVDVPTVKIEHDINDSRHDQRPVALRQLFSANSASPSRSSIPPASANGNGNSRHPGADPPGTPLGTLNVFRATSSSATRVETYLVNQLDLTARFRTGFVDTRARRHRGGARNVRSDRARRSPLTARPRCCFPIPPTVQRHHLPVVQHQDDGLHLRRSTRSIRSSFDPQWELMGGLRFDRFDAELHAR